MVHPKDVALDLVDQQGRSAARLHLTLLPETAIDQRCPPLLDCRGVPEADRFLEAVQLLESVEYRYAIVGAANSQAVSVEPKEMFAPDDDTGRTGRVRPGLYTGGVKVKVFQGAIELGTAAFEVRARKLGYLDEYRQMIADVAEAATEAVMDRFAASGQTFVPAVDGDPLTLYQRFAFLQSLFTGHIFQAAVYQILARPYESWERVDQLRRPGQGMRGHRALSRELSRMGPREPWPDGPAGIGVPSRILEQRTESTLDNLPNQFVKFALQRWRECVQRLNDAMSILPPGLSVERGIRESQELLGELDALLSEELFREVESLSLFPGGNQVLQKQEGYRDVLRAFAQVEVAASLSWAGGDEVFRAGQRDVATLYEYWAYIQLAKLLRELCGIGFDLKDLLKVSEDGIGLDLRKGERTRLTGGAVRLGRRLDVEMWYNKGFQGPGSSLDSSSEGSWSVGMRPDMSIRISPEPGALEYCEPIWVHFDAKYRVERIKDLMDEDSSSDSGQARPLATHQANAVATAAKSEDLLKMHAYRDAIRLSSGAYVLYPGTQTRLRRTYTEILPGLGAFKLKPTGSGQTEGTEALRGFMDSILTHAARQASQHERMRFWNSRIYKGSKAKKGLTPGPLFSAPPADTKVLIGFVKSIAHAEWIRQAQFYNLRADGRRGSVSRDLLDCEVLLLRGSGLGTGLSLWRVGKYIETMSADELRDIGYPEPGGTRYYCLRLTEEVSNWAEPGWDEHWLEKRLAETLGESDYGSPRRVTWSQLIHSFNPEA